MATILCVDDEPAALLILRTALDQAGHRCIAVTNVDAAFNVLARGPIDLIISDYRMPEASGLDFLARLAEEGYEIPLVMATGYGSIEHAVAAIKAGAADYIVKPVRPEQLALVVDQALEFGRLRRENEALRREVRQLRGDQRVVGESAVLLRIMELVRTVAPTRAAVLLHGETGTGKDLLARTIHDLSDRSNGPFVSVNCAALPATLVEGLLFGQEKGDVGAARQVKGALERAHRGTLLLDEVSAMRPELQSRLLRVLQEQEFERVGGGSPVRVDIRLVATTTPDLADEVKHGRFHEELLFRLGVVPVHVPPLRARPEDVPLLARHFGARAAREIGRTFHGFTAAALERLRGYSWPGNVRELAHTVERALMTSPAGTLDEDAFDAVCPPAPASAHAWAPDGALRRDGAPAPLIVLNTLDIDQAEAALIERALELTQNNRTRAAELLGISVRTLRNKLNRELPAARID